MRVCILGAGDAGSTAAIQIRRLAEDAQIDIFSRRTALGCPPCEMPLALSGAVPGWDELVRGFRLNAFWEKRNIGLHLNTEVGNILRDQKRIVAGGKEYPYDKLILALGAIPAVPAFPGLNGKNEFTLSTDMADGTTLSKAIAESREAAIVGGGSIALEMADALRARGYGKVYLLARRSLLRSFLDDGMAGPIQEALAQNGVDVIVPAAIESVATRQGRKEITLPDRKLEADFIFFGTGANADTELARRAGLTIGPSGAIAVNQFLQTSDPDIYATGDCMENWDCITGSKRQHQIASNAIRTGYFAGRNAVLGNKLSYDGTVMSFVTKVFGHQVGSAGLTEREAQEKGLQTVSVMVDTPRLRERVNGHPAHYKLVADATTKTLIGAQVISQEIVTGTVDKLAVAIACKMPVMRLVQIDSCYSPDVQEDQIAVPLHRLIDKLGN